MSVARERLERWLQTRDERLSGLPWLRTGDDAGRTVRFVADEILVQDTGAAIAHRTLAGLGHRTSEIAEDEPRRGCAGCARPASTSSAAVRRLRGQLPQGSVVGPNHVFMSTPHEHGGPFGPPVAADALPAKLAPSPDDASPVRVVVMDTGIWLDSPLPAGCYSATPENHETVLDGDADGDARLRRRARQLHRRGRRAGHRRRAGPHREDPRQLRRVHRGRPGRGDHRPHRHRRAQPVARRVLGRRPAARGRCPPPCRRSCPAATGSWSPPPATTASPTARSGRPRSPRSGRPAVGRAGARGRRARRHRDLRVEQHRAVGQRRRTGRGHRQHVHQPPSCSPAAGRRGAARRSPRPRSSPRSSTGSRRPARSRRRRPRSGPRRRATRSAATRRCTAPGTARRKRGGTGRFLIGRFRSGRFPEGSSD